ncbi:MAG: DNA gyrase inhibitor YacG [Gammaproteobacteria bacterium]|nr:DNA gyrase inhibitor YacG [Gammaproteobacteria bacterium]NNJ93249.1 DNA gyrase inhibitor YacG [Halobacteria archaeon]
MTPPPVKSVTCPTCSATVVWTAKQRWRPFCSERCRLVDLGKWFDESNRIPAEQGLPEKPDTP